MKVLKKGPRRGGWVIRSYFCTGIRHGGGGCGAELLVDEGDLVRTFTETGYDVTVHVSFVCPVCRSWTDVDSQFTGDKSRLEEWTIWDDEVKHRAPGA